MSHEEMSLLSDDLSHTLSKHVIIIEKVGPVEVYVEGDLDKYRNSNNIFLTIHNIGSTYKHWLEFNQTFDMTQIRRRSLFLHISLSDQANHTCSDLPKFPSLDSLGLGLVTVLDTLRIHRVMILGDGAGANIGLRFALYHPTRVHGAVLVNCSGAGGQKDRWTWAVGQVVNRRRSREEQINSESLARYEEANRGRGEILSQLHKLECEVLVVTGNKVKQMEEGEAIHEGIRSGLSSIIKVETTGDPVREAKDKLADAVVLFAQGQGMVPTVRRKNSRSMSCNSTGSEMDESADSFVKPRKVSMEMADLPNTRKYSFQDSHEV